MLTALVASLTLSSTPWTLAVGGDIMLNQVAVQPNPLLAIAPIFSKADLAIANLEIPLTNAKTPTTKKSAKEVKDRHQFILRADPKHAANLKPMGFDYVSLGNNHAMDYQLPGLKQNLGAVSALGIAANGAGTSLTDAEKLAVVRGPGGIRIGFLSYLAFLTDMAASKCTPATANTAGVAFLRLGGTINDSARTWAAKKIKACKAKADLVFFCLHWGKERETLPTGYQVGLARMLVDAGADGVFGCHPHVLQGSEAYKGKPVLYSTGNLVSPRPALSAVYTLKFEGTKFKGLVTTPITIATGGKVSIDKDPVPGRRRIAALDKLLLQKYPLKREKAGRKN